MLLVSEISIVAPHPPLQSALTTVDTETVLPRLEASAVNVVARDPSEDAELSAVTAVEARSETTIVTRNIGQQVRIWTCRVRGDRQTQNKKERIRTTQSDQKKTRVVRTPENTQSVENLDLPY